MSGNRVAAHHHRVPGAKLLALLGKLDAGDPAKFLLDQFRPISDHDHDPPNFGSPQSVEHVPHHRPPTHGHKHLGELALHASSPTRGQHDGHRR
jgi:hypothetical protein